MKPKLEQLRFYCTCGSSGVGSASPRMADELRRAWASSHSGEGHAPCDQKTAAKERRRQDREDAKLARADRRERT